MSKKVQSEDGFLSAALDLQPVLNVYAGRDTSNFALMFDGDEGKSRTSQEFAEDSDINNIIARYYKTGTLPMYMDREMLEGDVDFMSYHEMQNAIASANSMFAALPAVVRARFDNDPAKFVEFVADEKNVEEARKLGLLSPEAVDRLDKAEADRVAAAAAAASPAVKPAGEAPKESAATQ